MEVGNVVFEPGDVTQLLIELRAGDQDAEAKLIQLVYAELRRLAAHYCEENAQNIHCSQLLLFMRHIYA